MKGIETKEKFMALRAEGQSIRAAAVAVGIDKTTGQKWQKENETAINTMKAERLEEAFQKYGAAKLARVKAYGETLGRIEEALAKRSFDDVPTEKLLDYKIKYINALGAEFAPIPMEAGQKQQFETICDTLIQNVFSGDVSPADLAKLLQETQKADAANNRCHPMFRF